MPKPVYRKKATKKTSKKGVKKKAKKKKVLKKKSNIVCIACGDTGINSKGKDCISCLRRKGAM